MPSPDTASRTAETPDYYTAVMPQQWCREATFEYHPRFERSKWHAGDRGLDRFFDRFVADQYTEGFSWRCKMLGGAELARAAPFEQHTDSAKRVIASNAEVLLNLFEAKHPADLDRMREAGKAILKRGTFDFTQHLEGDIPDLRDTMGREHHDKWLANFRALLTAGLRRDTNHPGNKEFDKLPESEKNILKVQVWANWRVLGLMTDGEYALIRAAAEKKAQEKLQSSPGA